MGSVGDAYDNAMCESFFATLECELIDRRRFPTVARARREVFSFIEGLLQHPPAALGARLQVARELRETRPCGLKRTCSAGGGRSSPGYSGLLASSGSLVTPLHRWKSEKKKPLSDTINHKY